MKVVIAAQGFKGNLSASQVCQALAAGILKAAPRANVVSIPMADGGEGMVETVIAAVGGSLIFTSVTGPLGEPVRAGWGSLSDGKTAIIEMAAASGLNLVPSPKRNPMITTTFGTGELVRVALDAGYRKIIIGIGGSATNDGGAGMAQALGVRFRDAAGQELPRGGAALAKLAHIDISSRDSRLAGATITLASDVINPLCGPRGASVVYGPQKGATPEMVEKLDKALQH
jgi:glycerate kinase